MKNSLNMVRTHFPQVVSVKDARKPLRVTVTKSDVSRANKKDPNSCAMAQACKRALKADGAIINISTSYIIKGNRAIRYKTSTTVSREITSFDRGSSFEEGKNYLLAAVPPAARLNAQRTRGDAPGPHKTKRNHVAVHRTENVRISSF